VLSRLGSPYCESGDTCFSAANSSHVLSYPYVEDMASNLSLQRPVFCRHIRIIVTNFIRSFFALEGIQTEEKYFISEPNNYLLITC
jgi:hypothetical protein